MLSPPSTGTRISSGAISLLCYFAIFIHDPVPNDTNEDGDYDAVKLLFSNYLRIAVLLTLRTLTDNEMESGRCVRIVSLRFLTSFILSTALLMMLNVVPVFFVQAVSVLQIHVAQGFCPRGDDGQNMQAWGRNLNHSIAFRTF